MLGQTMVGGRWTGARHEQFPASYLGMGGRCVFVRDRGRPVDGYGRVVAQACARHGRLVRAAGHMQVGVRSTKRWLVNTTTAASAKPRLHDLIAVWRMFVCARRAGPNRR